MGVHSGVWVVLLLVMLMVACQPSGSMPADDVESALQSMLEKTVQPHGFELGVAVHVDSPRLGLAWDGAIGLADPATGEAMTPGHPVRIASNTKTYVAAAVLRLWEDGRLELDAPIERYLPEELLEILRAGGYQPDVITVRHLLNHTSGLDDHGTDSYAESIFADPQHRWTRAEQVQLCVDEGSVQGAPGEVYRYSDTGYVLLGEILEQITGGTLAQAVWGLLEAERLGLRASWFESLEPRPEGVSARAHQFYGDDDVSGFDPSFDLWGGGGIAATMADMARFMRALFAGEVFRDRATLDEMLRSPEGVRPAAGADAGSLEPGAYRMGIWLAEHSGVSLYRHTGFWGTSASSVPSLDLVVTATANQHQAKAVMDDVVSGAIDVVLKASATTPAGE